MGGFKVVYEYANHLSARGHRINVVHPLLLFSKPVKLKKRLGVPVVLAASRLLGLPRVRWFDISPRVNVLTVRSLRQGLIPEGDVIVATAWETVKSVVGYSSSKGRKFYLVQDFDPWLGSKDDLEATWRAPLEKVAVSGWLLDKVVGGGGENVTVVPNGIDHQRFRLLEGVRRNPNQVAMLYSKVSYKASDDGLRALQTCRARHPSLQAILFGAGAPSARMPSWITCRSNVPEQTLVQIYNQCAIYLCSSLAEGFALPPAEAMACGCAVVSTDCGGIREYAEHEVTALLSAPGNVEALASNLVRLLEDDQLRSRLAGAGSRRIQDFTWEKAVDKFEKIILTENGDA